MRRALGSLRCVRLLTALALAGGISSGARAQVALDTFRPAPLVDDGFALSRPTVLAHAQYNLQALIDYANDPLVLHLTRSHSQFSVVHNQLVVHVGGAVGIGARVTLFGSLPVHTWMAGTNPGRYGAPADGAGIGDLMLGGRVRMVGTATTRGMLSAELMLRAPTAELANDKQHYSGDAIGSYEPALVGELHLGRVDVRARAGARFRKHKSLGDLALGQEVVYGAGARVRIIEGLYGHAELYGASYLGSRIKPELSPLELLFGLKAQLADWNLGGAVGPGLVRGYGSPDLRAIGSLAYAPQPKSKPRPRDRDHDGLLDAQDKCPSEAEDRDGFQDADGCPELDDDGDGVSDALDRCPAVPEDHDQVEDGDGCPDLDNERDAILDRDDQCPRDIEARAAGSNADGCPDQDRDGDGVFDHNDHCPDERGSVEASGCPVVAVDAERQQLVVPSGIEFALNGDQILEPSVPVLETVRNTLQENPKLERIRIEGHTDASGVARKNLDLSMRRAASVARWFVEHGVTASRLEAWGCGKTRPLVPNDSEEHRQQNRRVEFHVLSAGDTAAAGDKCVQMKLDAATGKATPAPAR